MTFDKSKDCPRCSYNPTRGDKATAEEHKAACREGWRTGKPEYTANPGCSARTWHHNATWCDTCKGVA